MRLYIPALGDTMRLTAPWTFTLQHEDRNVTMFGHLDKTYVPYAYIYDGAAAAKLGYDVTPLTVTLEEGTILSIDRLYIRRGAKEYNSVTFNLLGVPTQSTRYGAIGRVRFWTSLADANEMYFEPCEKPTKKRKK